MPQISTTIQNLLNGVSQQADSQRFPSQAEEQINGLSSPVLGLSKRNPTEHITKLFNTVPTDVWAQALNRDSTERYMVVVRATVKKTISSFDLSGDLINCTAHGFSNGDEVRFYDAGLPDYLPIDDSVVETSRYYVVNANTDDFQIRKPESIIIGNNKEYAIDIMMKTTFDEGSFFKIMTEILLNRFVIHEPLDKSKKSKNKNA